MKTIHELMDLQGRVAIVTGGAGHIGHSIAQALGEAGATIALVDKFPVDLERSAKALAERNITKVAQFSVDLSVEAEVRALPERVAEELGSIDILVNCAAFVGTTKLDGWSVPFEEQASAAWRAAFEVNVTAVFELVQSSLPWLQKSGHGSIINVSSLYGSYGPDWRMYEGTPMANPAAYGASKGALNQLTQWLSTTLAPAVRCNTISPGGVWRNQPESFVEKYVERTPLKRMAIEEDFKGAALYLASDLSKYVTGQNLMVDGGWGAW
jgi:NAD(P)-dependent dehydrogenase (short-subunit alcohol dehydrogenase family)